MVDYQKYYQHISQHIYSHRYLPFCLQSAGQLLAGYQLLISGFAIEEVG